MMSLEKCRTCYNDIEPENLIRLDTIDLLYSISIGTKLNQCIPELELNTMKEKICKSCLNLMATVYNFRKMCLQTEATLKSKNFEVTTTSIKSEPSEVFIPMNIVKTEVTSEEDVHDLTSDENISRNNSSSEMDNLHAFGRDVITGDISVGFEITNAKQIHNTVSVSFTTNSEASCIFQAEKRSDFDSNIQCTSVQLDHETETTETQAQSPIALDTNALQCKTGLSDIEIAANFLKKRPSLRRKNIMNAAIKINKLRKSVLLALTKCNHKVYTCDFCEDVLVTRTRLRIHKKRHLRRIKYTQLENVDTSKKKRKSQHSPSRSPHLEKKIKVEIEEVDEHLMPSSDLQTATIQSPVSSHHSLPSGADTRKIKSNLFDNSRSMKIAGSKTKGDGRDSERFNARNLKPGKSKAELKSPVNKQQLLTTIKTEPLELSETEMKCDFCNIKFCSSNIYNLHMSLHPDENKPIKKHACVICKASFDLRVQLNGHMSTHSNKRARNKIKQHKAIVSNNGDTSQFKGKSLKTKESENAGSVAKAKPKQFRVITINNQETSQFKGKPPMTQQSQEKRSAATSKVKQFKVVASYDQETSHFKGKPLMTQQSEDERGAAKYKVKVSTNNNQETSQFKGKPVTGQQSKDERAAAKIKGKQFKVININSQGISQLKGKPLMTQQSEHETGATKTKVKQFQAIVSKVQESSQFERKPIMTQQPAALNKSVNLKNNKTDNSSEETNSKVIDCAKCGRKFGTVCHYNVHSCLKTNDTLKLLKCEVCQKYFLGRITFLEHVKSHLNGLT